MPTRLRRALPVVFIALFAATTFQVSQPPRAEAAGDGIWLSRAYVRSLPTGTAAWNSLVTIANQNPIAGNRTLIDQDSMHSRNTMAAALVALRNDSDAIRAKVRDAIKAVKGTEDSSSLRDNRLLQLGRNLPGYVIAADLIELSSFDPSFDASFRSWISALRTRDFGHVFKTLANADEHDAANWGAYDGAARAAIAAYLGDTADLKRSADAVRSFTGEVHDLRWNFRPDVHDMSWQCSYPDESGYRAINGACTRDGRNLDGLMPQDMARADGYRWPPATTDYPRENLNGRVIQAEILYANGYTDVYKWGNQGFLRAAMALRRLDSMDDSWFDGSQHVYKVLATRYGKTDWGLNASTRGRGVAGVDWTHRPGSTTPPAPSPTAAPTATPKPTAAPTATPTATPKPTAAPTATPKPTAAPTATPAPTHIPSPTAAPPSTVRTIVLGPTDDAKVKEGSPNGNYRSPDLWLKADERAGYIRFEVNGLPSGAVVQSAKLRLYVTDVTPYGAIISSTATSWNEETLTWNRRPSVILAGVARPASFPDKGWVELDVTKAVSRNGAVSFSITDGGRNSAVFAAKEDADDRGPRLQVSYQVP